MSVYLIADIKVTDDAWIPEYAGKVHKLVAKHGGAQLTCNQLIILGEVWTAFSGDRELCISDIQQLCKMPKATASRTVCNLAEDLGFIDLEVDPNDKRRKFLLPSTRLVQLDRKMSREFRKYWDATRA